MTAASWWKIATRLSPAPDETRKVLGARFIVRLPAA